MNKPLLIDFDGVLRLKDKPAPYLSDFFQFIYLNKIKACIISNSSISTSADFKLFLNNNNIEVNLSILTASESTAKYVKNNYKTASVYCDEKIKTLFADVDDADNPEAVVIGDVGLNYDAALLNEIFLKVYHGADIVAMHKNRFWNHPTKGLALDAGALVTAIEYATGKQAILIGKPSQIYYANALDELNCNIKDGFYMLGDDLETDIKGANMLGAFTMLVLTGKTTIQEIEESNLIPHYILSNLQEVIIALSE